MMQSSAAMPRVSRTVPKICQAAVLKRLSPQYSKEKLACCSFPKGSAQDLLEEFLAAPHFKKLDAETLLRGSRDGLRVILLTESSYYARQAAVYLSALWAQLHGEEPESSSQDSILDLDLGDLMDIADEQELKNSLAVISARLLDPRLDCAAADDEVHTAAQERQPPFSFSDLDGAYFLIAQETGSVLSQTVYDQLEEAADFAKGLFVALKPTQMDFSLMEELRFKLGFSILPVEAAKPAYLVQVLRAAARQYHLSLARQVKPEAVVARLQKLRGARFDENDIYSLVADAARRTPPKALTNRDLTYTPLDPRSIGRGSALEALDQMIGLTNVKAALRRQLAVFALQSRRPGGELPYYRSMAFSGPPGTGKSVTARLAAQILREQGCGTGRFVEAGREQLVGKFLGHTSGKVAKLFEQAKGGVLFIDEAGALIGDDDSYAVEAVNALVRHMELNPDTVVIFATYPDEMGRLLSSNPGLASRLNQQLEFTSYTDRELWDILDKQVKDGGYALPREAEETCLHFFRELKKRSGNSFGNGREARRLFLAALEEMAVRVFHSQEPGVFLPEDFRLAAQRLLENSSSETCSRPIGFCR